ncbi:TonB-dependent receptor [Sphingobium sp. DEHP117]|uniref:TonB-dependent receptor n=1 Tax=Sphingobium sp. DEHP117 TaxID=2993436 RepID=UPI0027D56E26|nr:TonB-dependent receptor [Sphingobium sp. DEHP117]MDQ4420992.1 TonB-dependent receptor [Sphingobium sp. DEHP117]
MKQLPIALSVSRFAISAGLIGSLLAAGAHAQTAGSSTPKAVEDSENGIVDIVVTATRRETSLQKTGQAISVVTGQQQLFTGRQGLDDLRTSVPNINFASTSNTTQLFVRGIGNTFIQAGGDPGVAIYQDSAYLSDQTTSSVSFFDVERVEVLRGPQGGLYGRNATGGAINVISAKPTSNTTGRISMLAGNYGRLESEGFVSGPLGFANTDFRLSYQIHRLDGFVRNLYRPSVGDPAYGATPDRLDDMKSDAVRFQTATELGSGGTLRIIVNHYREADNGPALAVVPTPGFIYPAEGINGVVPSSDPRNITVDEGSNKIRLTNVNVNLDQPIADGTLTVTGNYRRSKQDFLNDCDGTGVNNCSFRRETSSKDYFGDIHFASSTAGAFRYLLGATYTNLDQYQLSNVHWEVPMFYLGVPGDNTPFDLPTFAGGKIRSKSWAVYADVRYALSDVWSLVGQARYTKTTKKADETLLLPTFGLLSPHFPNGVKTSGVPFKVGFEGQLTPDILVYGNYSTGLKDAAINLGAQQATPVKKEQVKSFEAGFKSSFLDRKLQLNAAVFNSDYKNLQISQLVGTLIALTNVPKSRIRGAELEVVAQPMSGLRFNASLGYLDAKLKRFSNAPNVPIYFPPSVSIPLAGKQLPYVAKWNLTLGASYRFEPTDSVAVELGGNYYYQSRIFFNEFNTSANSQKAVGRVDLTASIGPSDDKWKVYGYIRNLTNETVLTGTTIYAGLLGAEKGVSYAPPRNFGVGFSYNF